MNQENDLMELSSMDQQFLNKLNAIEEEQLQDSKTIESSNAATQREGEPKKLKEQISMSSFWTLKNIGEGSYAKVQLVRKRDNGKIYAMKVIKKSLIASKNQKNNVISERNILLKIKNQYLIKMKYAFQDKTKIYFVLEYCGGGELFSLLSAKRYLNEQQTKFYAAQMVKAIEYLHSLNIVFRDLKPENVLIDKDGYIKLTDFGLSKMNVHSMTEATSMVGTPEYLSPEILQQKGHGKPVDWWTLGCIIWEMMTGLPPYFNQNHKVMWQQIVEAPLSVPAKINGNLKNLLTGLLEKDPHKRLGSVSGASEILDHPWFSDVRWDLLESRVITPPFKPVLESETDIKYINSEFTDLPLSPPESSTFAASNYSHFGNFTIGSLDSNSLRCSPPQQLQQHQFQQQHNDLDSQIEIESETSSQNIRNHVIVD